MLLSKKNSNRVHSKLKEQNSSTFQGPNFIFQAPKLSTKSHILDADIQNLDCNVTLKCTVLYCTHQYRNDKSKISKFSRFKFKDFSRIFKYFQTPYLFSSIFKGLEVFIPNASIFKDFSSTLWTLLKVHCIVIRRGSSHGHRYMYKSIYLKYSWIVILAVWKK